jgi:hypothetical protein
MQQADYRDGIVTGIHIFKSVAGVFKSSARYTHPNIEASNNFWPRDGSEKILAPWKDADSKRLRIREDPESPPESSTPRPDDDPQGPDLGDMGRIEFT